jgi:uncharacterized membrane protein YbjE (DUF340 family)
MDITLILLFLIVGFIIGYFKFLPEIFYKYSGYITEIGLIILLASMGARIGVDQSIINQLGVIGLKSFILALFSIIGSVLFLKLFAMFLKTNYKEVKEDENLNQESSDHRLTLMIVVSITIGLILGLTGLKEQYLPTIEVITTYALAALLFGVGIDIGLNKKAFKELRILGFKILIIPILIVIGTLFGTFIASLFLNMVAKDALAVGAGFGWYSLSAVLITKLHSVELGSIAFLTNVFRELITIISLPFVVKYIGKIPSIGPGGATTMDVTLPLIKKIAGEEIAIPAFISGVVLSTLVPFLVPFILSF